MNHAEEEHSEHYVLVGLGNPGRQYEYTRHNIGFLLAKMLARQLGFTFKEEKRFHALVAKGRYQTKTLHLLLPLTYMNESGRSVRAYLDFFNFKVNALMVVCDDVALPFGQLRLRAQGSPGGHNGLKSIEAHLGTREYVRLRMGIGKELGTATLAEYVLDLFKPEELEKLEGFLEQGSVVIKNVMTESIEKVMNRNG